MDQNEKVLAKLDQILKVAENIFILDAAKSGIPSGEIRAILHIDKNRVGAISKHVEGE